MKEFAPNGEELTPTKKGGNIAELLPRRVYSFTLIQFTGGIWLLLTEI